MATYRSDSSSATAVSAFGEPVHVEIHPVIQIDAAYGLPPRNYNTANTAGAVATTNGVLYLVSSGTSANGGAYIQTRRLLRYRAGQGALGRYTAAFSAPDANTEQLAGFITKEQSIVVGYNGTQFGVCRRNGGKVHIQTLTLTANTTLAGNCTLTLNGTPYDIPLTVNTTAVNAQEVAAFNFGSNWSTEVSGSVVTFIHTTVGPRSGTFLYSAGTTGATGSTTTTQTGVTHTSHWTYQADWNLDTLDGTGSPRNPSKMLLDPSKLNVYQINYRWLGVGVIRYAIENQTTGAMNFFHVEHYTNQYNTPHLDNPSFHMGYSANNITAGTSANVSVSGVCMLAANEGIREIARYTLGVSSGKKTSLAQDTLHHLITVRNNRVYQGKLNLRVLRLKRLTLALQGNDPVEVFLYLNASPSVSLLWTAEGLVESGSSYSTTTASFTFTNETPLASFVIAAGGAIDLDLENLNLDIAHADRVSVAVRSGQSITSVAGAVTWVED